MILSILNQSSDRPITERADSATVKSYLKIELENNGIVLPFEYAIIDRNGNIVYKSDKYDESTDKNAILTQALFSNDPDSRRHYLNVYFPDKDKYIFSSIKFMIPAFAFTLILLIIFLWTIILAFRQKKLSEMKNDFINNMTHEFKTPISTISLAAQMLNDDSVRKSPTMMQHISTVINDETKRLRFQVEKVLQMSMFDRQKATLKLQEVDANNVIANIVNTFKLKVEKYGGCINATLDAEDPIVNVDEMHFTNVIFNLLDNAVKYRRDDCPLELNVATRNLPNNRIEITIKDNGIGMDVMIYCDPARPEHIAELRLDFDLNAVRAVNRDKEGRVVYLKYFGVRYVGDNIRSEVERYSYERDRKDPSRYTNTPMDGNDHAMDAISYGAVTHLRWLGVTNRAGEE